MAISESFLPSARIVAIADLAPSISSGLIWGSSTTTDSGLVPPGAGSDAGSGSDRGCVGVVAEPASLASEFGFG